MPQPIVDQIKKICQAYDLWPARSKGQNFLINQKVLNQIITRAELLPTDTVLEVGPGLGILTEALVKKVKKVISVELDAKLFGFLKAKFAGASNLELINEDILKFNPETYNLKSISYKIVANLPYNITSHFLKNFLTRRERPATMTLLVQKEVAERICAKPGQMSLLSVSAQLYGDPEIIEIVGRNNFWPVPKVDSAILRISKIKNQPQVDKFLEGITEKFFWQMAKIGFAAKRKQLQNNLAAGFKISSDDLKKMLNEANFNPKIRAQELSVADWLKLAKELNNYLN
ncbi:MAG: 16S rRNA (adenine(1518)-N(6)/adenine(1519)-N(6))-dimethyltransferase RsmA [Candidatus Buchananbacteria bacterium]